MYYITFKNILTLKKCYSGKDICKKILEVQEKNWKRCLVKMKGRKSEKWGNHSVQEVSLTPVRKRGKEKIFDTKKA